MERFFKKVSNNGLKLLIIVTKRRTVDARLGPDCVSAVGYKTVPILQAKISPRYQVNIA